MYSSSAWRRVRAVVLARDNFACQIRGPRCEITARTADHIIPARVAPERFFDMTNLRAACRPCNFGHAGQEPTWERRPSREW
jgi:5-methylcytosine-specific restriction protein A